MTIVRIGSSGTNLMFAAATVRSKLPFFLRHRQLWRAPRRSSGLVFHVVFGLFPDAALTSITQTISPS